MASAVYSEPPVSRISIPFEGNSSASPFPSPSSSFLPPPTPGAHEFALKPTPAGRNGRKSSTSNSSNPPSPQETGPVNGETVSHTEAKSPSKHLSLNDVQEPDASSLVPEPSDIPVPVSPSLILPMTPTPSSIQRQYLEPPPSPHEQQSSSSSTTPTTQTASLPPEDGTTAAPDLTELSSEIVIPASLDTSIPLESPASPAFSAFSTSSQTSSMAGDPSLFSSRPAPPSPVSRRVSGAPSMASTRSRPSRPPSASVSRANSLRKSASSRSIHASPVLNPHRQSLNSFAPLPLPQCSALSLNTPSSAASSSLSFSMTSPLPPTPTTTTTIAAVPTTPSIQRRVYIKIRDFGFLTTDERHLGLGPEVPKPNRVGRMNRRLGARTLSQYSVGSSDGDGEEEEEEEDEEGWGNGGWDGFRMGLGRFNWNMGGGNSAASVMEQEKRDAAAAAAAAFPTRMDLDMNFLAGDEELGHDEEDEDDYVDGALDEEEDALYPGLYRALYAFEPEGIAEMRLEEDQIVRVVGRGGGVGWAVVIDDKFTSSLSEGVTANGLAAPKHALVPESYLEVVELDWEYEEAAVNTPSPAKPEVTPTVT